MLVRGLLVIAEKLKTKSIISCIAGLWEIEGLSLALSLSLVLLVWVVGVFKTFMWLLYIYWEVNGCLWEFKHWLSTMALRLFTVRRYPLYFLIGLFLSTQYFIMLGDFGVGFHSTVRLKTIKYVSLSPHPLVVSAVLFLALPFSFIIFKQQSRLELTCRFMWRLHDPGFPGKWVSQSPPVSI